MKPTVLTVTLNPSMDKTILLDEFKEGSLNRVKQIRLDPGGKGINVARLLHNFKVPVLAVGLSGGPEGGELIRHLRQAGIAVEFMPIGGRTRTNLKIFDASKQVTTEINESGAEVAPNELDQFIERLNVCLDSATHLVLGGSLPPGIPASIYAEIIEMAKRRGIVTVLDADGEALKEGLRAAPYALKPNIHELEQWCGRRLETDEDIVAVGRELIGQGVSLVLISMGEKGSIALDDKEAFRVTPFPIVPKSTVGAGDSMVAAMIYCMLNDKPLIETAAWTAAAGTLTASKEGTQVCTLSEVNEHVHLVKVNKI
jgi:1-phosphofructokinase